MTVSARLGRRQRCKQQALSCRCLTLQRSHHEASNGPARLRLLHGARRRRTHDCACSCLPPALQIANSKQAPLAGVVPLQRSHHAAPPDRARLRLLNGARRRRAHDCECSSLPSALHTGTCRCRRHLKQAPPAGVLPLQRSRYVDPHDRASLRLLHGLRRRRTHDGECSSRPSSAVQTAGTILQVFDFATKPP